MAIPRKIRKRIILSAIWFALVLCLAVDGEDIGVFCSVLTTFAVLPVLVVWGIAWIRAAPKEPRAKLSELHQDVPPTKKGNYRKSIVVLTSGIAAVIVAESLIPPVRNTGVYIAVSLAKILSYSLILAIVSMVVALGKPKATKFKVFTWLFLVSGLLDLGGAGYCMYMRQEVSDIIAGRPATLGSMTGDYTKGEATAKAFRLDLNKYVLVDTGNERNRPTKYTPALGKNWGRVLNIKY